MALDVIRTHHQPADLVAEEFLHAGLEGGLPGLRHSASPSAAAGARRPNYVI
jgi:hypothetical protein